MPSRPSISAFSIAKCSSLARDWSQSSVPGPINNSRMAMAIVSGGSPHPHYLTAYRRATCEMGIGINAMTLFTQSPVRSHTRRFSLFY